VQSLVGSLQSGEACATSRLHKTNSFGISPRPTKDDGFDDDDDDDDDGCCCCCFSNDDDAKKRRVVV
jgi:hypothetical protein